MLNYFNKILLRRSFTLQNLKILKRPNGTSFQQTSPACLGLSGRKYAEFLFHQTTFQILIRQLSARSIDVFTAAHT